MNNLLYFPYINLPDSAWTIRTLMYYENIGAIVPNQYFYNPDRYYDTHMLNLVRNDLVIPINPIEKLDNPWEISKPFLEFLNKPSYKIDEKRAKFQRNQTSRIHRDKFKNRDANIHADKFDSEIFYQLEQIGLAKRDKENQKWYFVESKTADLLMTYLAYVLSSKLKMRPITDKIKKPYKLAGKIIEPEKKKISKKRETILKELIPFPEELDLTRLQKFKEKHFELLDAFKNKVEILTLDNNLKEGTPLFNEKVRELKLRKDELSAKMNESQFKNIIFGTICGVIGAYQGLSVAETPGAVVGAIPGFASAIHSALKIEKAENIFDQSGMKYLALVDKRLK
nr:hypothetical protein [uncultured Draconibacterium sp.]